MDRWTSILHNLDRTEERRDWRFARHVRDGIEPDSFGESTDADGADPGFDARAEAFLASNEQLLRRYFEAGAGKRRRRLGRRIAALLMADELMSRERFERLVSLGPRRGKEVVAAA